MDRLNSVIHMLKKIHYLEESKITFIKSSDSKINTCKMAISDIISESNFQYDFYHSYKHYLDLSNDPNYINIYYKINYNYMPIVTDVCLKGSSLTDNTYNDYIKIATGNLSNLTIYCDSLNIEIFPKESSLYLNINEDIDLD